MPYKDPLKLSNALIEDSDVPAVSPKERVAPGGLIGEFQRAGHYVHDVTDNSFRVNGTPFKIVANNSAGFDVYYGDKKVANDIGNHKDFIALMERIIKEGGLPGGDK